MGYPLRVAMVKPIGFRVEYAINVHMVDSSGKLNQVDSERANKQWQALYDVYRNLGIEVTVFDGDERFPDMVFCANTFFSFKTSGGQNAALLSNMRNEQRKGEVALIGEKLRELGVECINLPFDEPFEAMGDLLWEYESGRLFGGFGYRTTESALDGVGRILEKPINRLRLVDEAFYHLDTCLSIFSNEVAAYVPSAFDEEGKKVLTSAFSKLIEIDRDEAINQFAANCHCPDGKNVIVQRGAEHFNSQVQSAGFNIVELDTDEFMKSGGSVFCMKQMLPWD